jgi:tetraacyldisaccharide 4'-kinase
MLSFWKSKNIISNLLLPISWLYGFISKVNICIRSKNAYKAKSFVISIGNINVGGTGKTPLTIALANYLVSENLKVAIIGHSYKASLEYSEVVNNNFSVEQIGDEAKQMLKMLNSDVLMIVGKNRLDSVKLAEEKNAEVIILDDGFTATYINRDLNVVVVDGKVQLGNKRVMPAGPLREPISGLSRSDCLVVINRHTNLNFNYIKEEFYLKSKISYSKNIETKSLYAFCGLGVPEKFYSSLNKEGLCIKEQKSFADHYSYTNEDINDIIKDADNKNLQLVTTLKDLVKISPNFHNKIELIMLEIELTKLFKQFVMLKISNFINKK